MTTNWLRPCDFLPTRTQSTTDVLRPAWLFPPCVGAACRGGAHRDPSLEIILLVRPIAQRMLPSRAVPLMAPPRKPQSKLPHLMPKLPHLMPHRAAADTAADFLDRLTPRRTLVLALIQTIALLSFVAAVSTLPTS